MVRLVRRRTDRQLGALTFPFTCVQRFVFGVSLPSLLSILGGTEPVVMKSSKVYGLQRREFLVIGVLCFDVSLPKHPSNFVNDFAQGILVTKHFVRTFNSWVFLFGEVAVRK